MRAFIITADDRPGMVAAATGAAAEAGIQLRIVSGLANGDTGLLALAADDDAGLRAALRNGGWSAREVELVTTVIDHRPGTAAALARRLADAGVNLEIFGPLGMSGDRIEMAIGGDDPAAIRRAVGS